MLVMRRSINLEYIIKVYIEYNLDSGEPYPWETKEQSR